jgi:hypothetical protein
VQERSPGLAGLRFRLHGGKKELVDVLEQPAWDPPESKK